MIIPYVSVTVATFTNHSTYRLSLLLLRQDWGKGRKLNLKEFDIHSVSQFWLHNQNT